MVCQWLPLPVSVQWMPKLLVTLPALRYAQPDRRNVWPRNVSSGHPKYVSRTLPRWIALVMPSGCVAGIVLVSLLAPSLSRSWSGLPFGLRTRFDP